MERMVLSKRVVCLVEMGREIIPTMLNKLISQISQKNTNNRNKIEEITLRKIMIANLRVRMKKKQGGKI